MFKTKLKAAVDGVLLFTQCIESLSLVQIFIFIH